FFSSRRRHTRFSRDWSSDVALPIYAQHVHARRAVRAAVDLEHEDAAGGRIVRRTADVRRPNLAGQAERGVRGDIPRLLPPGLHRSEERRVGKECRAWRATAEYKVQW